MTSATPDATNFYTNKFSDLAYAPLSDTGLMISQAGFGTYRTAVGNDQHTSALRYALTQGINLIDTSTNYGDGKAEELVGLVVGQLVDEGILQREEIVVVSKGGYLQGQNLVVARERKAEGRPFPNLIHVSQQMDHCIHPDFLADQISRSLARLGMETIDVYLLHNPEYYLEWAYDAKIARREAQAEYIRRIKLAFTHLETEVRNGRLQYYGISSNTLPIRRDVFSFTSLSAILNSGDFPHFKVIQLPFNLVETGAATNKNQPDHTRTVLDVAQQAGLAVLVNRPLNALQKENLIRLADVLPPAYPTTPLEVSTTVDRLREIELTLENEILPTLNLPQDQQEQLWQSLAVGTMLQGRWRGFGTLQNWRDIRARFLLPRANQGLQLLADQPDLPEITVAWSDEYVAIYNEVVSAIEAFYEEEGAKMANDIRSTAVAADPDWQADTLSQLAIRALRSTEGVTAVLVGMRQIAYVNDVLTELKRPITQQNRTESWQKMNRQKIKTG